MQPLLAVIISTALLLHAGRYNGNKHTKKKTAAAKQVLAPVRSTAKAFYKLTVNTGLLLAP